MIHFTRTVRGSAPALQCLQCLHSKTLEACGTNREGVPPNGASFDGLEREGSTCQSRGERVVPPLPPAGSEGVGVHWCVVVAGENAYIKFQRDQV